MEAANDLRTDINYNATTIHDTAYGNANIGGDGAGANVLLLRLGITRAPMLLIIVRIGAIIVIVAAPRITLLFRIGDHVAATATNNN